MWIEFVGLPGAGKSTIARTLASRLEAAGSECVLNPNFARAARSRRMHRRGRISHGVSDFVSAVRLTVRSRKLWGHLLVHLGQSHILPRYWRFMRIWAALERIARKERSQGSDGIVIFDQGILQCLRSIYPTPTESASEYQLTLIAVEAIQLVLPDLVVVVYIDESIAADRMRARTVQKTWYDESSSELEAQLLPHKRYAEEILPFVLEGTTTRVLKLDGTMEPTENADRATKYVMCHAGLELADEPDA